MYWTYIIQSTTTKKHYIGYTSDLEQRLKQHNSNHTKSIKNRGPFIVVYSEQHATREEAYRRERQLKSYKGGNAFKRLVEDR